jgi:hypothetical protein
VVSSSIQQQIAGSLTNWIFQQDKLATAAMLLSITLIACAVYGMFWFAPTQLAEIRKGYERIEESHQRERADDRLAHQAHFAESESRHQAHFSEMLSKVEAVTETQSRLIEKLILREQGSKP